MKYTILIIGLLAQAGAALASSVTIVSVSGISNGQDILTQAAGETWTQTGNYTDVTITADLRGNPTGMGTAYLMDQIGPGASVSNELASPFTFAANGLDTVTLFSNLTLGPGTYDLIIDGSAFGSPAGWPGTLNPTYTLDSGVGGVEELSVSGTQAAFAPASTFTASADFPFFFTVTGTPAAISTTPPATGNTVPEPGTLGLLGAGLSVLLLATRRR